MLTIKQKQELAKAYMKKHSINFGNEMANERAEEMFVDALSMKEEMYDHTLSEFKKSHTEMLKATWAEMIKWTKQT